MSGAKIVEYGLKALVWMIDAGFLLAFFVFLGTGILGAMDRMKEEKADDKQDAVVIGLIILAILCGIFTVILFGLAIMPWWS